MKNYTYKTCKTLVPFIMTVSAMSSALCPEPSNMSQKCKHGNKLMTLLSFFIGRHKDASLQKVL